MDINWDLVQKIAGILNIGILNDTQNIFDSPIYRCRSFVFLSKRQEAVNAVKRTKLEYVAHT